MNRICFYIEKEFNNIVLELKKKSTFNYNFLKYDDVYADDEYMQLLSLSEDYTLAIRKYKQAKKHDKEQEYSSRITMKRYYRAKVREICPDDHRRMNIMLDIAYAANGNKQFCWDCVGELIVKRLEECK